MRQPRPDRATRGGAAFVLRWASPPAPAGPSFARNAEPASTVGAGGKLIPLLEAERIDARRFERLIGEVQQLLADDPKAARGLFERALGLWRGAPLADLREFAFAAREAGRLEELHATSVEGVVEARLALGEHDHVVGQITTLVAANPLRERPRRLLMLALYRSGRHAEALGAYRDAVTALDEIGLEPSPQLRQLEADILQHDPSLGAPSPRPARSKSLGATRRPRLWF